MSRVKVCTHINKVACKKSKIQNTCKNIHRRICPYTKHKALLTYTVLTPSNVDIPNANSNRNETKHSRPCYITFKSLSFLNDREYQSVTS